MFNQFIITPAPFKCEGWCFVIGGRFIMRRTIINEWTSDWQTSYEEEARQLKRVFQEQLIQIFHIGSTSIPTIGYAKPIIDIVMGVANIDLVALYNEKMATLGYVAHGANGITDRFYYTKGGNNRTHHVHIYHADIKILTSFAI